MSLCSFTYVFHHETSSFFTVRVIPFYSYFLIYRNDVEISLNPFVLCHKTKYRNPLTKYLNILFFITDNYVIKVCCFTDYPYLVSPVEEVDTAPPHEEDAAPPPSVEVVAPHPPPVILIIGFPRRERGWNTRSSFSA